jgi:branched-chain amino acid transport system substrate-binding protein
MQTLCLADQATCLNAPFWRQFHNKRREEKMQRSSLPLLVLLLTFFLISADALAEKRYGPGVTDTEIKLGQTMPYSGAASVYGQIGRAELAYFEMLNAKGGINGRKIRLLSLDDGYLPPKTVEQVRKLVEGEQVLAIFGSIGTATNVAVRNYLNARKVPHLFVGGGDAVWGDYKNFPWTMGWGGSYQMEGRLYAEHILANRPNARIGILSINDDYGRDLVKGFKDGLGDRAASMVVAEQTYEFSDPTVSSQIVSLKSSGADTFFGAAFGKHASQAYRKMYDIGWRPQVYIGVAAASPEGILKPAGLHTAKGFITAYYAKSPEFPAIRNDPAMQDYFAWAKEWYPEGNAEDGIFTYGYQVAQVMEYVLRAAGDNLTRENLMRIATHMDHVEIPMLYPGITANTSPTDYFPLEQFQMFQFDGKNWLPFGPVVGK